MIFVRVSAIECHGCRSRNGERLLMYGGDGLEEEGCVGLSDARLMVQQ